MPIPSTSSLATPALANTVVAMPRQNAAALFLDDLTGFNPLVRREDNPILEPFYKDFNVLQALDYAGASVTTKQLKYRNYEQGPPAGICIPLPITGATMSTSTTGGSVPMMLTPGSFSPRRISTSTGATLSYSGLQENDYIYTYNGLAALITAESGAQGTNQITYTVTRSDNSNADLLTALNYHATAGLQLVIMSNAYGEGSLQPLRGLEKENVYYENQVMTVKTHRASTGDVDAVEVIDINGVVRVAEKQMLEMTEEHKRKVMLGLWYGKGETYQKASENLPLVRLTRGVDQSIRDRGATYRYALTAGFVTADGDAVIAALETLRGGNEYQIWAGSDAFAAWQEYFRAKTAGMPTGVYTFASFGASDGKKKAADIGFTQLTVRGITFHLVRGDMFNVPGITDVAGFGFSGTSYIIPGELQTVGGDFRSTENGQSATSVKIPSLMAMFTTTAKNAQRKYHYWERPIEVTNRDQTDRELLTQVGARLTHSRKFLICQGV